MLCEPSRGARAGASARASAICAVDTSATQLLNASAAAGSTKSRGARAASASTKVSKATKGPTSAGSDGGASGGGCPANLLVGKRIRVYSRAERRWFKGTIRSYTVDTEACTVYHLVVYDDGDKQNEARTRT